ncbi:hypothetical protein SPRG_01544 [Saprolegnia parasitica CBS 223.65]|uniref:Sphingomyelin synthase-like domain-containing protein n=1 Tax=Saprolegnia parasitica (strain CBS 223.65) TaxID=695850 RepID=A0A067CV66_SAPPC|nr:hypothetical protein SPRG_01544 [Saprolegnia parasitica CBS 223.65]KDO34408.1 hypothetical protein SPRG_01544 [Saprolegnia parasitica CBS 223.65]|eukprot:XP_012195142.1 hypothetical protein SPRG_01544 [Saprolegnia parasitica CBS 223.65]
MSPLNYLEKLMVSTDLLRPPRSSTYDEAYEKCHPLRETTTTVEYQAAPIRDDHDAPFYVAWKHKWDQGTYSKLDIALTFAVFFWTLQYYTTFLRWNENRTDIEGFVTMHDPVLMRLSPGDYSVSLFVLAYGSVSIGLYHARHMPELIIEMLQTKAFVIWVRMVALYLVPLEAPVGTVPLIDPIAGGDGIVLMRDLFFSGHTATTFMIFLVVRRQNVLWKSFFFVLALTTAILVMLQKTHYAIDVYAAPFFVYTCNSIVYDLRVACNAACPPKPKRD